MSFSSYTHNYSYNASGNLFSSTNMMSKAQKPLTIKKGKRPKKRQEKYLKLFPEINARRSSKRVTKSLNNSFEGKIIVDRANIQYSCINNGIKENSQIEEATPKSFQKNMESMINKKRKQVNIGRSIIFRKKRKPKFTNNSYSDKFFSKIRDQVAMEKFQGSRTSKKPDFLLKGKALNPHLKYRKMKRRYQQRKAKSSYTDLDLESGPKRKKTGLPKKRVVNTSFRGAKNPKVSQKKSKCVHRKIVKKPRQKKKSSQRQKMEKEIKAENEPRGSYLLPKITITKTTSQEDNNNSTADSTKDKQPRFGLWSMKAEKVLAKKAKHGYEEDIFYNSENNSQGDRKDDTPKPDPIPDRIDTSVGIGFICQSYSSRESMEFQNSPLMVRKTRHKPSKSCLVNSDFKMDEGLLIKPKTMKEITCGFLPLDEIEQEDEKRFNAVKNYKTEIEKAQSYAPYRSNSCSKSVRWQLTNEQLTRETKARKKRRGSPSAKSMRNKQTKKQIQVVEIQGGAFGLDDSPKNKKPSLNLMSLPGLDDSPPAVGRVGRGRRKRKARSDCFTGGFGSML